MNEPIWRAVASSHAQEWSHWIEAVDNSLLPGGCPLVAAVATGEAAAENARLIAAAPELRAALETIARQCGPYAEREPALDYASIGNIARFALAHLERKP